MSVNSSKSKWVRLGDYINEFDVRNSDKKIKKVKSVSVTKEFKETNAKVNKEELQGYKLVPPFHLSYVQTTKNEKCFANALNTTNETYVVTQVNKVFFVKNPKVLNIEYLNIIFKGEEFDRYAIFNSWGSARETFDWTILCETQIPLPDIEIQQELVNAYNGLKALAEQNEALSKPLTEACQAYIVDCIKKYPAVRFGEYIEQTVSTNNDLLYGANDVVGMTITKQIIPTKADVKNTDLTKFLIVSPREFVYNPRTHGKKIGLGFNNKDKKLIISWNNISFKVKDSELDVNVLPEYLYLLFCREEWDREACYRSLGSSTEVFSWDEMCNMKFPFPPPEVQQAIVNIHNSAEEAKSIAFEAREKMKTFCPALVQRVIN